MRDEAEFLARLVVVATLVEVVAMLAQTHFLLGNVQFLKVINQFLLEAVLVVLARSGQFGEVLRDALLDDLVATLLERFDLSQQIENQFNAVQQVFLQSLSFLNTEAVDDVEGLVEGLPYLGDESLIIILNRDVENARHLEQHGGHVGSRRNVELNRDGLDLFLVGLHNVLVDVVGLGQIGVGDGDNRIDFAALQLGTNPVAEVQLGGTQFVGQFDLQVQLFAVQRLDFDGDFLCIKSLLGYTIASHGTNHKS